MPLLTPEEAANELSMSTKQLRLLTDEGRIRYINIGRGSQRETRRYDPEDIQDFVRSSKVRRRPEAGAGVKIDHRQSGGRLGAEAEIERIAARLRAKLAGK